MTLWGDPHVDQVEGTWTVAITDPNGRRKTITITPEARARIWTVPLNFNSALYVAMSILRDWEDARETSEKLGGLVQNGIEERALREGSTGAPEDGAAWGRRARRSWWPFNADSADPSGDDG